MADDQTPLDIPPLVAGQIRFFQAAPPALPPGDYKIHVTQDLTGGEGDKYAPERGVAEGKYPTTSPFTIAGPRFNLKPSEVYSVYPPQGHFGPFDNALPHVVFTRRTLPWERSLDGGKIDPENPVPWMALLLLSPSDFGDPGKLPDVTGRTVKDLLHPAANILGPQNLTLQNGETEQDLCNTIDLPIDLFTEITPSIDDMPYLAHVREVNTGGKETLSLKQDGWFTVVLGNRMPETTEADEGIHNLVCLVSLEGFKDHLPTVSDDGTPSLNKPGGVDTVRLAVLADWNFTCYGHNDFKVRMADLDDKSLLSLDAVKLQGDDDGTKAVNTAFSLGYAALNHTTRLGEKTVSWYRGPMVPLKMDPKSPYAFIPTSDRALRYDDTGMFATEYAAAFELGRMLALQNRGISNALYRYRNSVKLAAEVEVKTADIINGFNVSSIMSDDDSLEDAVATLFETSTGLG